MPRRFTTRFPFLLAAALTAALLPGRPARAGINETSYSANQTHATPGFSVGEQFSSWAGLQGDGNGDYTMTVTLSVQPAAGPAAVPEPSSLVPMSAGLVAMLVARTRRRRGRGRP
jgi:hypothetical protein